MVNKGQNNKKPDKKKCLFERILNWILLALLLLLTITLVVLRAPWKLVAVFIAVLLVNTVVPKPLRKRIWFVVALFAVVFIIWVFLPDDPEEWRPYTFDKELAAMETRRFVKDQENAAVIYNQLLKTYDTNTFDKDFLRNFMPLKGMRPFDPNSVRTPGSYLNNKELIFSEFWKSSDFPEVASWLQENEHIIDRLMLASKKDKCYFPIAAYIADHGLKPPADFDEAVKLWVSVPEVVLPMRKWSELLIISANNDIAEGRVDSALEKYIASLQMAQHLRQHPNTTVFLSGLSINCSVLERINEYIVAGNVDRENLNLFNNVVQNINYDLDSDLRQIFDLEKLMFKNIMCAMFYQVNSEGKVRFSRDPRATFRAEPLISCIMVSGKSGYKPMDPDSYWQIKLTKAMSPLCWFFVPSTPQKTALLIDDIYQKHYSMGDSEYDWQRELDKFSLKSIRLNLSCFLEMMSRISASDWPRVYNIYLRVIARQRGSKLLIALRRCKNETGRWPETLNELKDALPAEIFIDPLNNDPFMYRLTEDSFVLYSKGKNNIDESFEAHALPCEKSCSSPLCSNKFDKKKPDDILIWPTEK